MKTILLVALATLASAGCATTSQSRAEQLAYCQQMDRGMGTDPRHDHADARGSSPNPMNMTHDQCRRVLGKGP